MSAPPCRCWVGNAASFCLCCRPTHSPSGSPIRTTSFIRCGAGIVGYWTDWPGDCHSPGILKLTTEGQVLFTHGWFLEPTPSAPQSGEHCRWWLIQISNSVSLSSPLWTCIVAGETTSSRVSTHSPPLSVRCNVLVQYTSYKLYKFLFTIT